MLAVGDWWRRSLKVAVLLLLAAEMRLLSDARPTTRSMYRRHGPPSPPRHAAVTDARSGTSPPGRWTTPCAGSTTADTALHPAVSSSSSSWSEDDDVTSQHGRRRLLRRLARQMSRLADRVDRLKLRYVSRLAYKYTPLQISTGFAPWQRYCTAL